MCRVLSPFLALSSLYTSPPGLMSVHLPQALIPMVPPQPCHFQLQWLFQIFIVCSPTLTSISFLSSCLRLVFQLHQPVHSTTTYSALVLLPLFSTLECSAVSHYLLYTLDFLASFFYHLVTLI